MRAVVAEVNTIILDRTASTLDGIIAAVGDELTLIYICEPITITKNLVVPPTCSIVIELEGTINQGTYTLTFNGSFKAPMRRVFLGSGAITFDPKSTEYVLPQWFGALASDNIADATTNAAAFSATFASLRATYISDIAGTSKKITSKVIIPPGVYYTDSQVSIGVVGSVVEGYGVGLRYTGATGACLKITANDVTLRGPLIALHTDSASVYGVHIYRTDRNFVSDLRIIGSTPGMQSNIGVYLEANFGTTGMTNRIENIHASCGRSIYILDSPGALPKGGNNYFCNISDRSYNGILISGASGAYFDYVYSDIGNTGAGYALTINKNGTSVATGNEIVFAKMGTCLGVSIAVDCVNNLITKMDRSSGTDTVLVPGSNTNYIESFDLDYPVSTSRMLTFTNGDLTPSVRGRRLCRTANTTAKTISMLDDGAEGQEVKVLFNDNNTTVDFTGTHLKGNGGVDWAPKQYDYMDCVFDGIDWYCKVVDCTT